MSNSPRPHGTHGTGSGRRTTPTTRSPSEKSLPPGASRTRPSDSWPRISRSSPGGAQPYSPETISMSVPHTPSATPSTSSSPSRGSGSGTSRTSAEFAFSGTTVSARMGRRLRRVHELALIRGRNAPLSARAERQHRGRDDGRGGHPDGPPEGVAEGIRERGRGLLLHPRRRLLQRAAPARRRAHAHANLVLEDDRQRRGSHGPAHALQDVQRARRPRHRGTVE